MTGNEGEYLLLMVVVKGRKCPVSRLQDREVCPHPHPRCRRLRPCCGEAGPSVHEKAESTKIAYHCYLSVHLDIPFLNSLMQQRSAAGAPVFTRQV